MGPGGRSMGRHTSLEDPTVTEHSQGSKARRRRRDSSYDESSRLVAVNSDNGPNGSEVKFIKIAESNNETLYAKSETEARMGIGSKLDGQNLQPLEPPKQDYIHVRARRGQATDSHSLAERARREKISERMKILQDLIPGCNKVIGKASVLDEIINYIQALQHQVEAYDTMTSNASVREQQWGMNTARGHTGFKCSLEVPLKEST
ncbi:hypothetical protein ZIOFF_053283 [Zingiber officinale]|uniref:BHLH domain-containing protein n=1 Tax=Zingiber officinale TaxID=94328 RepID=A0A8J5KID7_ZINOF|nr:hypothetical protein ZIOFF_053283 [Zingiber officinale]